MRQLEEEIRQQQHFQHRRERINNKEELLTWVSTDHVIMLSVPFCSQHHVYLLLDEGIQCFRGRRSAKVKGQDIFHGNWNKQVCVDCKEVLVVDVSFR